MLYLLLLFVLQAVCLKEYTVKMSKTPKDARDILEAEGFQILKILPVPGWYHVACVEDGCEKRTRSLRSEAHHMHPLKYEKMYHRSDLSERQFFITCNRFEQPMPYCQNIEPCWNDLCATGAGVTVAIVDDGVAMHDDYWYAYDESNSLDVNFGEEHAYPNRGASHGTSVAGIIASGPNNDICGRGIAYGANISSIKLLGAAMSDAQSAEALSAKGCLPIYSNSWGPNDYAPQMSGPGPATLDAIDHCTATGRGGLGSIYVWAAGNGGSYMEGQTLYSGNTNFDGFANNRKVIAVAALNSAGYKPSYGEIGAANFITAYSSGGSYGGGLLSISTTKNEYGNSGACTNNFGGTSASCPQIAAVVALMLSKNPRLTRRDVMSILAHTGQIVDPQIISAPWQYQTGLLPYSEAYGFGLVDAYAAVLMGESWQTLPIEQSYRSSHPRTRNVDVQPGDPIGFMMTVPENSVKKIEWVTVDISARFDGSYKDMFSFKVVSPQGRIARMVRSHNVDYKQISWKFSSPMWMDANPVGDWNFIFVNAGETKFTIEDITLEIFGH